MGTELRNPACSRPDWSDRRDMIRSGGETVIKREWSIIFYKYRNLIGPVITWFKSCDYHRVGIHARTNQNTRSMTWWNFPSGFLPIRTNGFTRHAETFLKFFDQSQWTISKRTEYHPIKRSAAGRRPAKFLILSNILMKIYFLRYRSPNSCVRVPIGPTPWFDWVNIM